MAFYLIEIESAIKHFLLIYSIAQTEEKLWKSLKDLNLHVHVNPYL